MDCFAVVIPAQGEPQIVTKYRGETWLGIFYREIGCSTVDCFAVTDWIDAWVDDEALFADEPRRNEVARRLIAELADAEVLPITGTVVFTGGADSQGDTMGLDDVQALGIVEAAKQIARDL